MLKFENRTDPMTCTQGEGKLTTTWRISRYKEEYKEEYDQELIALEGKTTYDYR